MGSKSNGRSSYDPLIAQSIARQTELGERGMGFALQQYQDSQARQARADSLAERVTSQQLRLADAAEQRAGEAYRRYQETFAPIENEIAAEARQAGTVAEQDAAAGRAGADFRSATAATDDANARRAAALGMKYTPTTTNSVASAAGLAGTMNQARTAEKGRGLMLKGNALNIGRGLSADTNAGYGMALGAGTSALGASQTGNAYLAQRGAGVMGGYGMGMGANQAAASGWGQMGGRELSAQSAADASRASTIGTAVGLMAAMSDRRVKTGIRLVGEHVNGLNLYRFKYKPEFAGDFGDGEFVGVMADEVEMLRPECVMVGADGIKRVDYARLGMRMERV